MKMEFTLKSYETMIKKIYKNGYEFAYYKGYEKYKKAVILRHDIDVDVKKAVEMAKLEKSLGVSSTYYVLLTSDFYNLFSKKNEERLNVILDLGHHIGLHFDEVRYGENCNVVEKIEEELEVLEEYLGRTIDTVSMHRPSKKTLDENYKIRNGETINSYSTEFFKGFKYISDSRKNWGGEGKEDLFEIIENGTYHRLHILTHPIWYDVEEISLRSSLERFIKEAKVERWNSLNENVRDMGKVLTLSEIYE